MVTDLHFFAMAAGNAESGAAAADFARWFPRAVVPASQTQLRIVCFAGAGCTEGVFSARTVAGRKAENPLLDWAIARGNIELLSLQVRGGGRRRGKNSKLKRKKKKMEREIIYSPFIFFFSSPQLPGRDGRRAEPCLPTMEAASVAVEAVLRERLRDGVPWMVIGHSMGSWLAHAVVLRAVENGAPPPLHAVVHDLFLSFFLLLRT
jgi:hypothetical protein